MILALDIGTSSVRASLYDNNADPVPKAFAKINRTLTVTTCGGAEINAVEAFAQVVAVIDAVLKKTEKLRSEIEIVASCSFWHSLIGIDAAGKATTKVLGWADTRSRDYTDILRKQFNETATHNRTGARFHSSFWPAKLLWLQKDFPEVFAKTDRWLSFSDYVALKLFGVSVTSISMASGTAIFDIRKCAWDTELLNYLHLGPQDLALLTDNDSDTFTLNKKYATRWPRLSRARWFPAVGDGAADNIGAGCVTKSRAALMVGTSGAMRVAYTGEPPIEIPAGLWCYRIDRKRVIVGGALSDGGGLYHWLKKTLKLPKDADEQLAKRVPGAHGLTFLPFLAGERSTGYHESAAGAVLGLTSATDSVDILRAALESVAYRFAEIFDQLDTVVKVKEIVATGGGLRESPVWVQVIADVLGRDLAMNPVPESSSRGAVLLAHSAAGNIKNIDALAVSDTAITAYNHKCHAMYELARKQANSASVFWLDRE